MTTERIYDTYEEALAEAERQIRELSKPGVDPLLKYAVRVRYRQGPVIPRTPGAEEAKP